MASSHTQTGTRTEPGPVTLGTHPAPHAPSRGRRCRAVSPDLLALHALALVAVLALAPLIPPPPLPADASPAAFSAARALSHLPTLAGEPHPVGSPAQQRVRDYLVRQLDDLSLAPQIQRAVGASPLPGSPRTAAVENVVGRRGEDSR